LRVCKDLLLKLSTTHHYRLRCAYPLSLPSSKNNSG